MSNKGGRVSPDYLADIAPEYADYDYIQENRIIKEVWKGNIRRVRYIDISGVLPCCVQSLCNPYVHIIETAQHSGHLISIYNFDQEDGNIFLS